MNELKYRIGDVVQLVDGTYSTIESIESAEADNVITCPPLVCLKGHAKAVTSDDIKFVVTGLHFCERSQVLFVNNIDNLTASDWQEFTSGFRTWAVHRSCMDSVLEICNKLHISWSDVDIASNFNPFTSYDRLSAFSKLLAEFLHETPPDDDRCLLCVHGKHLMYTFDEDYIN